MQQLDEAVSFFYSVNCEEQQDVELMAQRLAVVTGGELSDQSLGADVWFACLHLPDGLVQLHYDWLADGFWLRPTGLLASEPVLWQALIEKVKLETNNS
ncbi:hypothetical protein GCM10011369_01840 [Neiella marina]|uniref:DUF3630 family protein n=1 Tax=Neiella marina TaxID=508461 RepID=A0A8J2XMG5_9GAMM|nr:hypothetical protein [Neiella marina]GGA64072.1 hypothetical protein GCM10011369_01840 [Neiella marina]